MSKRFSRERLNLATEQMQASFLWSPQRWKEDREQLLQIIKEKKILKVDKCFVILMEPNCNVIDILGREAELRRKKTEDVV